ncbi:hypothetical protein, conserved [Eimeria tenella]|uniref:Uncharacterized protein n=1 Tax=Eimeria tenella TaxID=5802 RepID=U6KRA1_EIMTE|nr:hypothetical protein, conserved [Eimeria tenella]CDJ39433.1 hypothetical protein, conserved [Eimeria tenella]|eukprot:XP_013230188.1 hypothetical protein, conserved [Eimeria tenella]
MQMIDGARELLRQSVMTLQSEMCSGSRLLWKKWIRLEQKYGDKSSLRTVVELRALQRLGLGPEAAACCLEDREQQTENPAADAAAAAAVAVAAAAESEATCCFSPNKAAADLDPAEVAAAKFKIRKRAGLM